MQSPRNGEASLKRVIQVYHIIKELKLTIVGEKIALKTIKTKTPKSFQIHKKEWKKYLLFTQNDKCQSENPGTSVQDIN